MEQETKVGIKSNIIHVFEYRIPMVEPTFQASKITAYRRVCKPIRPVIIHHFVERQIS